MRIYQENSVVGNLHTYEYTLSKLTNFSWDLNSTTGLRTLTFTFIAPQTGTFTIAYQKNALIGYYTT